MNLIKHIATLFCSLLLFAGTSSTARAEYVTMHFTAKVNLVDDSSKALNGKIKIGDVIKGLYTYDRATAPTSTYDNYARAYNWNFGGSGITVYTNAGTFRTRPSSVEVMAYVANNQSSTTPALVQDVFVMSSTSNEFAVSPPGTVSFQSIGVQFTDMIGWPLNSTKLPFGSVFYLPHWNESAKVTIKSDGFPYDMEINADILSVEEVL